MRPSQISVHIFDRFASAVSPEWIERVVAATLSVEDGASASSVSVVIADDECVAELNLTQRGVEGTTDVLSFSNVHSGRYYGADADERADSLADPDEFVLPPGHEPGLGELVISYPQVSRQAAEAGHAVEKELAVMLAHGVFHLLGYDHESEPEAERMRRMERKAWQRFYTENGAPERWTKL